MGKGSPIVPVRFPPLLLAAMDDAIRELGKRKKKMQFSRSKFILFAVSEKLAHRERSRKSSGKKKKPIVMDVNEEMREASNGML
jgi:metal-responsive CopG/Arc/MetJ family transcriptional regulator